MWMAVSSPPWSCKWGGDEKDPILLDRMGSVMQEIIFGFVVSGFRPFGFAAEPAGRWFRKQIRYQTASAVVDRPEQIEQPVGFAAEPAERWFRKQIRYQTVSAVVGQPEQIEQTVDSAAELVGRWSRKQIHFRIFDLERPGQPVGFAVEFFGR